MNIWGQVYFRGYTAMNITYVYNERPSLISGNTFHFLSTETIKQQYEAR